MIEEQNPAAAKPSELSALLDELHGLLVYAYQCGSCDQRVNPAKTGDGLRSSAHGWADQIVRQGGTLVNEISEALFQRDLARTDASEEARCADALHKELNGAAAEVKALRRALANMVSAQHAGPITDEMHVAWENARQLLTPNAD